MSKAIDRAAGAKRERVELRGGIAPGAENYIHTGTYQGTMPNGKPATPEAEQWAGWGTALKPAHEPVVLARKPLSGTIAETVLEYGTGALNVDGTRVGSNPGYRYDADRNGTLFHGEQGARIPQTADGKGQQFIESADGRWPSNLIMSHHADCERVGVKRVKGAGFELNRPERSNGNVYMGGHKPSPFEGHADADGMETVDEYRCVEGCPIRLLDLQAAGGSSDGFSKIGSWESGTHGSTSTSETAAGIGDGESRGAERFTDSLKADGSGSETTGPSRPDTKSTTSTSTSPTTTPPISGSSQSPNTTTFTSDSEKTIEQSQMEASPGDANDVASTSRSADSTSDEQEHFRVTARNVPAHTSANGGLAGPSPSRFFATFHPLTYQAKASRRERNAGLDGFAEGETKRYGDRGAGELPKQTSQGVIRGANTHPT